MVSILGTRQHKSPNVKFSEDGSVTKKKGILSKKVPGPGDKENGMGRVGLKKGRSDVYSKLRSQIEILESDQQEARKKIEELEAEEMKLLMGSQTAMTVDMDKKFATVEYGIIMSLKTELAEQELVIDEKNIEIAEKNDELMSKDAEIEELKEKLKMMKDKLAQASKSLAWWEPGVQDYIYVCRESNDVKQINLMLFDV